MPNSLRLRNQMCRMTFSMAVFSAGRSGIDSIDPVLVLVPTPSKTSYLTRGPCSSSERRETRPPFQLDWVESGNFPGPNVNVSKRTPTIHSAELRSKEAIPGNGSKLSTEVEVGYSNCSRCSHHQAVVWSYVARPL